MNMKIFNDNNRNSCFLSYFNQIKLLMTRLIINHSIISNHYNKLWSNWLPK